MTSRRAQGGFTLIELLVVVAILGIVTVALSNVLILGFNTTASNGARLSDGNGTDLVSLWFGRDVGQTAATGVSTPATDCAGASGGKLTLVTAAGTVSYAVRTVNGETQLFRTRCTGTPSPQLLARWLDPAQPVTVTVTPSLANWRVIKLDLRMESGAQVQYQATRRTS